MMYRDRRDAGRRLAERLMAYHYNAVVLAIPRGGVPVGFEVAKRLEVPLDLIVPRKLPIPSEPEAGFGAIAPDGTIVLNERLVAYYGITAKDIENVSQEVLAEIRRRIIRHRA